MTCATIDVVPLAGSALASAVSVMVEPVGASNGTFWHAAAASATMTAAPAARTRKERVIMKTGNILISMELAGQARRRPGRHGEAGYTMAALLVAMSIMAIMLTVVMPVWKQMAQREKEEELVFRGEQYARAIGLFQRKFANAAPPNFDVLVDQHFLRKKYKDPITNGDFVPVAQSQLQQSSGSASGGRGGSSTSGSQSTAGRGGSMSGRTPAPSGAGTAAPGSQAGGILGVTSKSTDTSIRLYKGRNHYNEWQFVYAPPAAAPGAPTQSGQPQRTPTTPSGMRTPGPMGPGPGTRGGSGAPGPGGGRGGGGGRGTGTDPFGPQAPQRPGR